MTITTPTAYTPSSPAEMPSRHISTPPPLAVPTLSPKSSMRPLDGGDKLTDANLKKQNREMDDAGASLEQKKRSYSQDLYEYTKTMCAEVTKAVGAGSSPSPTGSNTDSSTLSLSSLSLKDSHELPTANQSVNVQ